MPDELKTTSEMPAATKPTVSETPAADTHEEDAFDAPRAQALITKLRGQVKDADKNAKRLTELEANEAKRTEAEMTTAQVAEKRLAELQAKLVAAETAAQVQTEAVQRRIIEYEIKLAAKERGLDPKAAVKLLDWAALEFDAEGQPKNLAKVLDALLKEYPYLAQPANGPTFGTPAGRSRLAQPLPTQTPRKIIPL